MNEGSRRGLAVPAWGGRAIQRRVLTRASQDSHFKTQLFRFVDVYPNLRDSGDLVRHLRAYLADRGELPPPLDRMLGPNGERRLPSWAVARLTDRTMQRMAKTFIAGKDAKEALDELKRLRRQHTAFTVDILGETCLSDMEATDYANRYLEALQTLPPKLARWSADSFLDETPWGANPRVNISLKISSL
jgi:RHH-type proline utilization regulon transcriptional repressor/proline dehydrogenase/delta 1-pyrroline-5-carboxylate dehydrogenase